MNKFGRPTKCRSIEAPPQFNGFKPRGVQSRRLEAIVLTVDEFEAIRLADYNNLNHEDSSLSMGISRSVFTRLLEGARNKVAQAIVDGKELVIDGGNIEYRRKHRNCRRFFNEECDQCLESEGENNGKSGN